MIKIRDIKIEINDFDFDMFEVNVGNDTIYIDGEELQNIIKQGLYEYLNPYLKEGELPQT